MHRVNRVKLYATSDTARSQSIVGVFVICRICCGAFQWANSSVYLQLAFKLHCLFVFSVYRFSHDQVAQNIYLRTKARLDPDCCIGLFQHTGAGNASPDWKHQTIIDCCFAGFTIEVNLSNICFGVFNGVRIRRCER